MPQVPVDPLRKRFASDAALQYTLFVRALIRQWYPTGGQAQLIRAAAARGILPHGTTRKTVSEHLTGRYKKGPSWPITMMIVGALPETASQEQILITAAEMYQASYQVAPPGYTGPIGDPDKPYAPSPPDVVSEPSVPVSDSISDPSDNSDTLARLLAEEMRGRRDAEDRVSELEQAFTLEYDSRLLVPEFSRQLADLREHYARVRAELEMTSTPGTVSARPIVNLPHRSLAQGQVMLGTLAQQITPVALPICRGLARYLCTYAEFSGAALPAIASHARLRPETVQQILTARRLPTSDELQQLAEALHADYATACTYRRAAIRQRHDHDAAFDVIAGQLTDVSRDTTAILADHQTRSDTLTDPTPTDNPTTPDLQVTGASADPTQRGSDLCDIPTIRLSDALAVHQGHRVVDASTTVELSAVPLADVQFVDGALGRPGSRMGPRFRLTLICVAAMIGVVVAMTPAATALAFGERTRRDGPLVALGIGGVLLGGLSGAVVTLGGRPRYSPRHGPARRRRRAVRPFPAFVVRSGRAAIYRSRRW